jgi:hypothetical protein
MPVLKTLFRSVRSLSPLGKTIVVGPESHRRAYRSHMRRVFRNLERSGVPRKVAPRAAARN